MLTRLHWAIAAWFVILVFQVTADEISLIRVGESWRYFLGMNEPSQPVNTWRDIGFDDASWMSGPSGFSYTREATQWPGLSNYGAVYLRKTFPVADPAAVRWLVLRLGYEDGFVAYLNGTEILRQNLEGDPVPYNAVAIRDNLYENTQDFDVSSYIYLLRPGDNVLAIQVHSATPLYANVALVPELLANFNRGPYLQNATPTSMQIIWRTPVASDATVEYGVNGTLSSVNRIDGATLSHVVTLTDLQPDTEYSYRLKSSADGVTATSPVFTFRTFKTAGDISFLVMGDSGYGSWSQFAMARRIREASGDLVLHTGDVTYFALEYVHVDTRFLSVYGEQMRGTPCFATIGNHDLYSAAADAVYLDTFYLPTNSATGTEHYYSFDHGNVHFVSLFAPWFHQLPQYILARPSEANPQGSLQYQWLTNDLAHTSKPWKILLFHVPIRTSSLHRYDDYNGNSVPDPVELQQILMPVITRYGVQLAINGHDHNFERFVPTNGFHSVVLGSSGNGLYYLNERDPLSAQFWKTFSAFKVSVHGDNLRLEAFDSDGVVFDSMTIQKAPPPRRIWSATWHTPAVESFPANDGDGNIFGQTFDFLGTPIPAPSGQFSNLGEIFVNNDATYLYLGIHQAMTPLASTIFLFLQSARLTGTETMSGLGNGILDPQGQGADGLDYLENLGFTNFHPAVACILGDEMVDAQDRSWQSSNSAFATGQGVFYLNDQFTEVPDVRLQQFNISPQDINSPYHQGDRLEQNADLIKIAIPLSALGGIRAGDIIKLGAIVGGSNSDPVVQTRQIDTGFLGCTLVGSGTNSVLLEGLEVRLAMSPNPDDSDGDGLLDSWETANGLDPLSGAGSDGAQGDPDGDGYTNWQEQFAGTDPQNNASVLRLSAAIVESGLLRLSWQAVLGRQYEVLSSSTLNGTFTQLNQPGWPRMATATNESMVLELSADSPKFFRVRGLPANP
jgi:hypothetical protein